MLCMYVRSCDFMYVYVTHACMDTYNVCNVYVMMMYDDSNAYYSIYICRFCLPSFFVLSCTLTLRYQI